MNPILLLDAVVLVGGIETYSVCRLNSIGQQVPGTGTFLLERNSSHGLSVDPSNCLSAHPIALKYGRVTACVHALIFQHKRARQQLPHGIATMAVDAIGHYAATNRTFCFQFVYKE